MSSNKRGGTIEQIAPSDNSELFTAPPATSGNRFLRPFARPGIGLGSLTTHRQMATMSQTTIAANFREAFDVHRNLAP